MHFPEESSNQLGEGKGESGATGRGGGSVFY